MSAKSNIKYAISAANQVKPNNNVKPLNLIVACTKMNTKFMHFTQFWPGHDFYDLVLLLTLTVDSVFYCVVLIDCYEKTLKKLFSYAEDDRDAPKQYGQRKHKKARRFIAKKTRIYDILRFQFSDPHPFYRQ